MKRSPLTDSDFRGVIAVPPLPRREDAQRTLDFDQASKLLHHLAAGGLSRFMFGGNAFLYHMPLREYSSLLDWMTALPDAWWMLPAAGPAFGRLMDQAPLLRGRDFPAVMVLPCSDPRDATGLESGLRAFADAAATRLILYLKSEDTFGADLARGLDAIGRLCGDGVCVGIKYAVVRQDPAEDAYLQALLERVPRDRVASGIGERPAVVHLQTWKLPGFTTGCGCVAPAATQGIFDASLAGQWSEAEKLRERFLPLEDCRDAWNPAKVLHHAVDLAGVVRTGPIPPFLSALDSGKIERIRGCVASLLRGD